VHRSFGASGIGGRRTELLGIASSEIAIEEIPTGKGKVSVDSYRVRGFEAPTLDP
jgi:hypothetical protein